MSSSRKFPGNRSSKVRKSRKNKKGRRRSISVPPSNRRRFSNSLHQLEILLKHAKSKQLYEERQTEKVEQIRLRSCRLNKNNNGGEITDSKQKKRVINERGGNQKLSTLKKKIKDEEINKKIKMDYFENNMDDYNNINNNNVDVVREKSKKKLSKTDPSGNGGGERKMGKNGGDRRGLDNSKKRIENVSIRRKLINESTAARNEYYDEVRKETEEEVLKRKEENLKKKVEKIRKRGVCLRRKNESRRNEILEQERQRKLEKERNLKLRQELIEEEMQKKRKKNSLEAKKKRDKRIRKVRRRQIEEERKRKKLIEKQRRAREKEEERKRIEKLENDRKERELRYLMENTKRMINSGMESKDIEVSFEKMKKNVKRSDSTNVKRELLKTLSPRKSIQNKSSFQKHSRSFSAAPIIKSNNFSEEDDDNLGFENSPQRKFTKEIQSPVVGVDRIPIVEIDLLDELEENNTKKPKNKLLIQTIEMGTKKEDDNNKEENLTPNSPYREELNRIQRAQKLIDSYITPDLGRKKKSEPVSDNTDSPSKRVVIFENKNAARVRKRFGKKNEKNELKRYKPKGIKKGTNINEFLIRKHLRTMKKIKLEEEFY